MQNSVLVLLYTLDEQTQVIKILRVLDQDSRMDVQMCNYSLRSTRFLCNLQVVYIL